MPNPLTQFTIEAPAKLNLHLAVLDRRPDGFHNLESIFTALSFADTLHFEVIPGKNTLELSINGAGSEIPLQENIIFKALSLFRGKTGFDSGLKITAEKRIPLGGGLGGGSSDAASTLLALQALAAPLLPAAWSKSSLFEMAAALGSDVPFFVQKTAAAWVTGRGEHIEPLEVPRLFFTLVNPGFPSDTAAAYRLLDKGDSHLFHDCFTDRSKGDSHLFHGMFHGEPQDWRFYNDFLPVFPESERTVYEGIISRLRELGADFASLSGAGSTCFGVFKEKVLAEKAAGVLRNKWSFVEVCSTI